MPKAAAAATMMRILELVILSPRKTRLNRQTPIQTCLKYADMKYIAHFEGIHGIIWPGD
jgi:hypothetical protein